jgi:hypothetical protein
VHELERCPDFHAAHVDVACRLAAQAGHPAARCAALALAVATGVPSAGGEAPSGEAGAEGGLILALCQAALESAAEAEQRGASPLAAFDQLVPALRLATRRLKAVGAARFAGGAARLGGLVAVAHAACARALAARAHDQCVTLATSATVLMEAQAAEVGGEGQRRGGKAAVLLMGVQALLERHATEPAPSAG